MKVRLEGDSGMDLSRVQYVTAEEDGDEFNVEAWIDGVRVGYAWCDRDGGRLQLCDIKVKKEMPRHFCRLRSFLGMKPPSLRGWGIGRKT